MTVVLADGAVATDVQATKAAIHEVVADGFATAGTIATDTAPCLLWQCDPYEEWCADWPMPINNVVMGVCANRLVADSFPGTVARETVTSYTAVG